MVSHKILEKTLEQAWTKFSTLTRQRLKGRRPLQTQKGNLTLIGNRNLEIRHTVKELEESEEFHILLKELSKKAVHEGSRNCHLSFWQNGVGNYLKRSRFYLQVANGEKLNVRIALQELLETLEKKTETITYLAPMGIYLSGERGH